MEKKKILVLCTGNSCRSQMAEGYLRHFAGYKAEVYSAGLEARGVNPRAVAIMKDDNIDISGQTSNTIDEYSGEDFDYVITVCDTDAGENYPVFPTSAERFHFNFPDPTEAFGPEEEVMEFFAMVRLYIKIYTRQFVKDNL